MAAQAADEAFIRYNPERSALVSLLGELKGQRDSDVGAAKTGAKLISRSAKRAAKPLDKIYKDAASRSSSVQGVLNADLAKLGPSAASLVAATNSGLASTGQSLQGARTRAAEEMAGRRVDAVASGRQEARNARASYRSESSKVLDRLIENEREAGTYASGRVAALAGERADRSVKRDATRTSSRDRAADRRSRERVATQRIEATAQKEKAKARKDRAKVRAERKETGEKITTAANRYEALSKTPLVNEEGASRMPTDAEIRDRLKGEGFSAVEIQKGYKRMRSKLKAPPKAKGPSGQQRPT
jgi:hypothetical protein